MAKKRTKKRTQPKAASGDNANGKNGTAGLKRSPKSMVIRVGAGQVGSSVSQLVKDVRAMMEPDTAGRLRERKKNRLRDYTTMAGPLGVTHFLLFSKSKSGNTNLRLALTPRGPTLHFRVENYSLCKDIAKSQKHPRGQEKTHVNPPLLVMNNFTSSNSEDSSNNNKVPKHLESLMTTVFQSLFPPISPQTTPLSSIGRIMLVNRETPSSSSNEEQEPYILNLRHYAITTKRVDVSRRIRRLDPREQRNKDKRDRSVPNLGRLGDVADYLLDPASGGYTSASDTEMESDAEVEVTENAAKKVLNKRDLQRVKAGEKRQSKTSSSAERRAVKLVELGPRMKLKLMKIEEGMCGGKVMWHDFVVKSEEESKEMEETWKKRREEKELRKKTQKENIERKKKAKEKGTGNADDKEGEMDEDNEEGDMEDWDSEDFDDEDAADEEDEEEDED